MPGNAAVDYRERSPDPTRELRADQPNAVTSTTDLYSSWDIFRTPVRRWSIWLQPLPATCDRLRAGDRGQLRRLLCARQLLVLAEESVELGEGVLDDPVVGHGDAGRARHVVEIRAELGSGDVECCLT